MRFFSSAFQAVEASFPEVAVLGQSPVEHATRLWPERVKPPLSVRPHGDKADDVEGVQVTTYAGLVNPRPGNEIIDLLQCQLV